MVGIKDMQMPSCCGDCELWYRGRTDDEPHCVIDYKLLVSLSRRDESCPLVEIDEVKE